MLDYSDLIGIPYRKHGRTKEGLDCYGLVIECWKRLGHELIDIWSDDNLSRLCDVTANLLNIHKTDKIQEGTILEIVGTDFIHIGMCINNKEFIHTTTQGVRISKISAYPIKDLYLWD